MSELREATTEEIEAAFGYAKDDCCGCSWSGLIVEMLEYLKDAGLTIVVANDK